MNDGGCMDISPLNPNLVFYTGNVYDSAYFVGVSHSSDGGETWEHDTIGLGTRGWAVAFDGVDENRVYVGGDSAYSYPCLLISTDLGATWTMSRTGLSGAVNVLMTIPGDSQLVYAGTTSGLFMSTDAGATWEITSLNRSVKTLVCDPNNPASIFAGTYGYGVYSSTDGGTTWDQMNDGLACNKVLSLALRPGTENTIYVGTEGGSVFRTTTGAGLAGSPPAAGCQSPTAISPNPCRGSATVRIDYELGSTGPVALTVHDVSGRLVRCLETGTRPAGRFVARWDGTDGHGHTVPAGVYFVRLSAGSTVSTGRLTLVR